MLAPQARGCPFGFATPIEQLWSRISHFNFSSERERAGGSLVLADYPVRTTGELKVQREVLSEERGERMVSLA